MTTTKQISYESLTLFLSPVAACSSACLSDACGTLLSLVDTLSRDFPDNPENAESLLRILKITHILTISPDKFSSMLNLVGDRKHEHITVTADDKAGLLVTLPHVCQFISSTLDNDAHSRVLVHCLVESRGCIAVCAHRELL